MNKILTTQSTNPWFFFREVDKGKHSPRIRQAVQIMRGDLPDEKQEMITMSFWKRERAYIPNPHYDASNRVDWTNSRPSFNDLIPDRQHIIIMPHEIKFFREFFDEIASEMRKFAQSL